jgi:hypothetical protein
MLAPARHSNILPEGINAMSQPQTLEFSLSGNVAGKPISATQGVPFSRFVEFNEDVQRYVQGADSKSVLSDLQVQVHEGSYLLRVLIPAGFLGSLLTDSAKISAGDLAEVDSNRAKVVQRWQEKARMDASLIYAVRSPTGAFAPFVVTQATHYRRQERTTWVAVERYLIGEITDWGGAQTINVHVRPRDSRDVLIVAATAEQIRGQRENLVFHKAIVHVQAKQNPKTRELKDYRLLDLRPYKPQVEDERLEELFAKGSKAWAGIPNAAAWVDELRGATHG